MARRYDHLREKAIELRTQYNMTLEEIIERLALPKTTIYYWIKDLPIPRTEKQTAAQRQRADQVRIKHAKLRDAAYQEGVAQAPELLKDPTFRDFVVLYMAEGYKRDRNTASFVNSDPQLVRIAHRWMCKLTVKSPSYNLQYHVDHDTDELRAFWGNYLNIKPTSIKLIRKSNSGQLAGRQFRSVHGLLTILVFDTYFRARLQAWMDIVKSQW
ncbi:MAG: hypothetical protein LCI00_00300 [Chloroflexi bacterium]|nr:hypothetical protein [Chloroflexota bacterium]MCC6894375.1 hypothetical protein [Anaerolineae bacterium]